MQQHYPNDSSAPRLRAFLLALALTVCGTVAAQPPREGFDVGQTSRLASLVPAGEVEQSASQ